MLPCPPARTIAYQYSPANSSLVQFRRSIGSVSPAAETLLTWRVGALGDLEAGRSTYRYRYVSHSGPEGQDLLMLANLKQTEGLLW